MIVAAFVAGYFIGSIPTAAFLADLRAIDLRSEGSGNPGTNNALRIGGPLLAASVLVVEVTKGYAAVWVGFSIGDELGAVAGGIAAVAGNVFNVWYRFSGGKGLGISLGVLAAAWPWVVPVLVTLIAISALATRSAGLSALIAMAGLVMASYTWPAQNWSTGGLADSGPRLAVLAVGMTAIMGWKHWRDSPLNPAWRLERITRA